MNLSIALLLFAFSFINALPTWNTSTVFPHDKHTFDLPHDLFSTIASFSDYKACAMMGMTSKALKRMTEPKNKKNRLLQIKKYCGLEQYLDMTSNGYLLFSNSYNYVRPSYIARKAATKITLDALCIHALVDNIRDIRDRLTHLTIRLPSKNMAISSKLNSAVEFYFYTLELLFKHKSSFRKITVITTSQSGPRYTYDTFEEKLFKILSPLSIDILDFVIKIRHPNRLVNPTISTLSATREFHRDIENYLGLPNLQHVILPPTRGDDSEILKISRSSTIKEVSIPKHLVAEALSIPNSINTLNIYSPLGQSIQNHINALLETNKILTGLLLNWQVCSMVTELSSILQKFKPTLESLSFTLQNTYEPTLMVNLLRMVLAGNNVLKKLNICMEIEFKFNHSFLEEAVNLESYSYSGAQPSEDRLQPLLSFVSSHKSLKSLSLDFRGSSTNTSFLTIYEKLVAAIQKNPSIQKIRLRDNFYVHDFESFVKLFSTKSKPLFGRGIKLNAIPIENIVRDLAESLEDRPLRKDNGQVMLLIDSI